jgi:hypothetical protein
MVSRGHCPICRGVDYQHSIFGHRVCWLLRGEVLISAVVATNKASRSRYRGEFAVWDPAPSQWLRTGYWGGRVSEGQLIEIKAETIRDWGNLVVVAGWSLNWGGRRPGFYCIFLFWIWKFQRRGPINQLPVIKKTRHTPSHRIRGSE